MNRQQFLNEATSKGLGALALPFLNVSDFFKEMPMGIVVAGGLLFSLVLTLYVIPAVYTVISTSKHKSEKPDSDYEN